MWHGIFADVKCSEYIVHKYETRLKPNPCDYLMKWQLTAGGLREVSVSKIETEMLNVLSPKWNLKVKQLLL